RLPAERGLPRRCPLAVPVGRCRGGCHGAPAAAPGGGAAGRPRAAQGGGGGGGRRGRRGAGAAGEVPRVTAGGRGLDRRWAPAAPALPVASSAFLVALKVAGFLATGSLALGSAPLDSLIDSFVYSASFFARRRGAAP